MQTLEETLNAIGLPTLVLDDHEREFIAGFISHRSAFFDSVCQQKAEKPQRELVLGLLTQSVEQNREAFSSTQATINNMTQLFEEHVGKAHAGKFKTSNQLELAALAKLWFLAQGYNGIDVSYANDHASEISNLLRPDEDSPEWHHQRQRFMQAYYAGIEQHHKNQPKASIFLTIKNQLKKAFK
ncbi:hypothetical protein C9I98_06675 [Photobacterium sanctipauli]|uniref:Uncharacterized protein n=1 Tax=Photobacterium sanctipauli TaxID=1342794 RepID=A0A2T3NWC2_9GAMM|nr:hypothetical protein [Photobacterium sanctipauli]PSW20531.1 hypothetical protein C9I98_06675 [Photobacterium sanctipauli]